MDLAEAVFASITRILTNGTQSLRPDEIDLVLKAVSAKRVGGPVVRRPLHAHTARAVFGRISRARHLGTGPESFYIHVHGVLHDTLRERAPQRDDRLLRDLFVQQFKQHSVGLRRYNEIKDKIPASDFVLPPLFLFTKDASEILYSPCLTIHGCPDDKLVIPVTNGRCGLLELKALYALTGDKKCTAEDLISAVGQAHSKYKNPRFPTHPPPASR